MKKKAYFCRDHYVVHVVLKRKKIYFCHDQGVVNVAAMGKIYFDIIAT